MKTIVDTIQTKTELCKHCYRCIRCCPVKAIKITAKDLNIDADRCICCGACLTACTQGALSLADDTMLVEKAITAGPAVCVIAPEIEAAFPDVTIGQIYNGLEALGFYAVEDMVVAEELTAAGYADLTSRDLSQPIIRSTCPAIVNYIEMYEPGLVRFLAPIADPMIVQGRLIKRLYEEKPLVVFIGPCIAKKKEIYKDSEKAVDIVITFNELEAMLKTAKIDLSECSTDSGLNLTLKRRLSAPGGFPLDFIGREHLTVSRGMRPAKEALAYLESGCDQRRFFDILHCRGCIDGPAFKSTGEWRGTANGLIADAGLFRQTEREDTVFGRVSGFGRLALMGGQTIEPQVTLMVEDLAKFAGVDISQTFSVRPAKKLGIDSKRIVQSLDAAGLADRSTHLNCAACGYNTCVDHAEAVVAGFSEWSACLLYERRIFNETTACLREASNTDGLTGLTNHRGFIEALTAELQRHARYRSQLSLIMIDLDNFKQINDTFGHLQGDALLKLLAEVLLKSLRETDIAARYGGDEFAIILPETGRNEAKAAAEKLRSKIEATVFWLNDEIRGTITLSLGVCDVVAGNVDPMAALSCADKALYQAKNAGRNCVVVAE